MLMKKIDEIEFYDGGKENKYSVKLEENEELYIYSTSETNKRNWINYIQDNDTMPLNREIEFTFNRGKFYFLSINDLCMFNTKIILRKNGIDYGVSEKGLEGLTW